MVSKVYSNRKNLTLTLITSNQLFNLDLIPQTDEKLYLIQASSLKKSYIIMVPNTELDGLIHKQLQITDYWLKTINYQIQQVYLFVEILYNKNIGNRLIKLLLILSREFGSYIEEGILINITLSHNDIANIIGTTRVTITRLLKDLIKSKLISIHSHQNKIVINNPQSLCNHFIY